jgi:hypothetical protein
LDDKCLAQSQWPVLAHSLSNLAKSMFAFFSPRLFALVRTSRKLVGRIGGQKSVVKKISYATIRHLTKVTGDLLK